ncbi:VanW family protein [Mahella australiensis]|uniref:VanW family protein n=1 Tax=Mahella australiensis TaxID=252966 RepID=UPI000312EED6|nr:VanW family protein [Mahella australiensis]
MRIWLGRTYHTILRYRQWYLSGVSYSSGYENKDNYPYIIFNHETPLIRNLKGADMWLQYNKIINLKLAVQKLNGAVIHSGQTFSYWKYIGRPTARKGYTEGMVLYNGQVRSGTGGGLCQLSNLIYWMTLHTPLTVVERWRHSYDVFPDDNRTQPFGSGATCAYPRLDLQIKNDTAQSFILALSVTDTHLCGQWRSTSPIQYHYEIYEGEHWITHEPLGQYVRHNIIYRRTFDEDDNILDDRPIVQNHAIMMYQPFLSEPKDSCQA